MISQIFRLPSDHLETHFEPERTRPKRSQGVDPPPSCSAMPAKMKKAAGSASAQAFLAAGGGGNPFAFGGSAADGGAAGGNAWDDHFDLSALPGDLQVILRKLSKRDSDTKLKALADLQQALAEQAPGSAQAAAASAASSSSSGGGSSSGGSGAAAVQGVMPSSSSSSSAMPVSVPEAFLAPFCQTYANRLALDPDRRVREKVHARCVVNAVLEYSLCLPSTQYD